MAVANNLLTLVTAKIQELFNLICFLMFSAKYFIKVRPRMKWEVLVFWLINHYHNWILLQFWLLTKCVYNVYKREQECYNIYKPRLDIATKSPVTIVRGALNKCVCLC